MRPTKPKVLEVLRVNLWHNDKIFEQKSFSERQIG